MHSRANCSARAAVAFMIASRATASSGVPLPGIESVRESSALRSKDNFALFVAVFVACQDLH